MSADRQPQERCDHCDRLRHKSIIFSTDAERFDFNAVCHTCAEYYFEHGVWPVIGEKEEYLDWLTPTMREDYIACELEGETRAERARERGVKPETVTEMVQRAHRRLQEIWAERNGAKTAGGEADA
jgi:hypothetical protein